MPDDAHDTLGQRFLRAGWATEMIQQPDSWDMTWTDKGLEQLRQLWEPLRQLEPDTMNAAEMIVLLSLVHAHGRDADGNRGQR